MHHQPTARCRQLGDGRHGGCRVLPGEVGEDALQHPGRRYRRVVACGGQGRAERRRREVDGHEPQRPDPGAQVSDPLPLVLLRAGMVDLEHSDTGQLRHPPRPSVEAGAHDHQLRVDSGPYGVVDSHGSGGHRLRLKPDEPDVQALRPRLWRHVGAGPFDSKALVVAQQRRCGRIVETPDREPAVRHGAALAHVHGGPARLPLAHRPSPAKPAAAVRSVSVTLRSRMVVEEHFRPVPRQACGCGRGVEVRGWRHAIFLRQVR